MMSDFCVPSTIENFPDELFLEIFQFLDVYDLCHSWSKLNRRLAAILRSVPMHAQLTAETDYEGSKAYLQHCASQLIYMSIECNWNLPEPLDMRPFSNLHSLHLKMLSHALFKQIVPDNMPHLTYLGVKRIQTGINPAFLLFGPVQFAHLTTCRFPCFFVTSDHLQPCLTVRSLYIQFCQHKIFYEQVLALLPNLMSFESVFGTSWYLSDVHPKANILLTRHNTLCYLKLQLHMFMTLNPLRQVLVLLPHLRWLSLSSNILIDFEKMANILQTHAPQLKYFKIIVQCIQNECIPDMAFVEKMSPWFAGMNMQKCDDNECIISNKLQLNEKNLIIYV
jgi:hypothetical protein